MTKAHNIRREMAFKAMQETGLWKEHRRQVWFWRGAWAITAIAFATLAIIIWQAPGADCKITKVKPGKVFYERVPANHTLSKGK